MKSPNKRAMTSAERAHVGKVKSLPCSVCGATGPSDAHHIRQSQHFTVVALCRECHSNWHGTKALWRVRKMDELTALSVTIKGLACGTD